MTGDATSAIKGLLNPVSIALVGATENSFWSKAIIDNLSTLGYRGEMHLIHPHQKEQFGRLCYPNVRSVPTRIDHAYVMTGSKQALSVLADCAAKGVLSVTMLTAGFKETGEQGARLEHDLEAYCREHGIALIGPNCLGFVNALAPVPAYALVMNDAPLPGSIGVVLQSGLMLLHVHRLAKSRNLGLSCLISSGYESVLDASDYLRFFVDDPQTTVIGAMLESIRRPDAFAAVAIEATRVGKPIVVLKTGRSVAAARTALAHTAALTGNDRVADAFLRQLGVSRVESAEELVETLGLFARRGWPQGRRAGVISTSGGSCGVIADLCKGTAIDLPDFGNETKSRLRKILPEFGTAQNPMDTTGVIILDGTLVPRAAAVVAHDPNIDFVVIAQDAPRLPGPNPERNEERIGYLARALADSPKFAHAVTSVAAELTPYGAELASRHDVHFGNGLALSVRALHHAVVHGERCSRFLKRPNTDAGIGRARLVRSGTALRSLNELDSMTLLRSAGISCVRHIVAKNADELATAVDVLRYPVAIKVLSADIQHKSDVGGVEVGISTEGELVSSYRRIVDSVQRQRPKAMIEGVLVAEHISEGFEVICGIDLDPQYGPVVLVGLGGVFVEVFDDVALRLAPFDLEEAHAMVGELRGHALLVGSRGRRPTDVEALAQTLVQLGELACARQDLVELDINPLFVMPENMGVVAADALVVLSE